MSYEKFKKFICIFTCIGEKLSGIWWKWIMILLMSLLQVVQTTAEEDMVISRQHVGAALYYKKQFYAATGNAKFSFVVNVPTQIHYNTDFSTVQCSDPRVRGIGPQAQTICFRSQRITATFHTVMRDLMIRLESYMNDTYNLFTTIPKTRGKRSWLPVITAIGRDALDFVTSEDLDEVKKYRYSYLILRGIV